MSHFCICINFYRIGKKYFNKSYSLFNASIGSKRDALNAGNNPAKKLNPIVMSQTLAISVIKKTGVELFPSLLELNPEFKIYPRITPVPKPEVAPNTPIRNASTRKRVKISKFCAPIAFKVPISRVLSITEVYSVVIIPTAPTINDTIAILKRKELNPPVNSLIVSMRAFTVVMPMSLP